MKRIVGILSLMLVLALVACGSGETSEAPVSNEVMGSEIKNLDLLTEDNVLSAITGTETNLTVYDIDDEFVVQFRDLLSQTSYTKVPDAVVSKENRYVVTTKLQNGESFRVEIYGGEYIRISDQFDGAYLKINNPDFESEFKKILWIE